MKRCVLVLGMHRSGTSAMAAILKILGIDFGKNFLGYDTGNVKGHFEHIDILHVNDDILAAFGSGWSDIRPLPEVWHTDKRIAQYKARIKEIIQRDFKEADIFGIKEPRISMLLPLYLDILHEMNIAPLLVIMQRPAKEIAHSLYARDKIPFKQSLKLTQKYTEAIIGACAGTKKVFIKFDELLQNPMAVIMNIQNSLDIPLKEFASVKKEISEFIDPRLKHFDSTRLTPATLKNNFTQAIDFMLPINTKRRKIVKNLFKSLQIKKKRES